MRHYLWTTSCDMQFVAFESNWRVKTIEPNGFMGGINRSKDLSFNSRACSFYKGELFLNWFELVCDCSRSFSTQWTRISSTICFNHASFSFSLLPNACFPWLFTNSIGDIQMFKYVFIGILNFNLTVEWLNLTHMKVHIICTIYDIWYMMSQIWIPICRLNSGIFRNCGPS